MPHLLELFKGTGSIGQAFEARGWRVTSVDVDARFNPTICCDVLQLKREMIEGPVDLIWASPPCTHYSIARSRAKTPRDLEGSDKLVRKVLELADELWCYYLFENPFTGLLKGRQVVAGIPLRVVDYCSYGAPYRKRTGIWTNSPWRPARPLCTYQCAATAAGKKKHMSRAQQGCGDAYGGRRNSLEELYSIPAELCEELAEWATKTLVSPE